MHDRNTQRDGAATRLTRQELVKQGAAVTAGLGLLGTAAGFTGSGAASTKMRAAPKRNVLRAVFSGAGNADTLDPTRAKTNVTYTVDGSLYETLVSVDGKWQWRPQLAESIERNKTGDLWTFRLRRDVFFHNGKRLTAADVGYSIRRCLDPAVGSDNLATLSVDLTPSGIEVAPKGDKHVIRFKLKQPNFIFPTRLATRYTQIIPDGAVAPFGIGTGPFMIDSFAAAQGFKIVRNPRYRNPAMPGLSGVTGLVVPDPASKLQAVLSGEAELCDPIDYASVGRIGSSSKVRILNAPDALFYYIALDTRVAPFDNNFVRLAIKHAVNRSRMRTVVARGHAKTAYDITVPPSSPVFPRSLLKSRKRDVARARRLLAQGGHPDGVKFKMYTAEVMAGLVDIAVLFKSDLAEAGIDVEIQQTPTATYMSDYYRKVSAFSVWQFPREPTDMMAQNLAAGAGGNATHWSNPVVTKAITEASRIEDPRVRNDLLRRALFTAANGSGMVVPMLADALWVGSKRLAGMRFDQIVIADWSRARLA